MAGPRTRTEPEGTTKVPPIIIPLSGISGIERAAVLAIIMGKRLGASVIFIRPPSSWIKGHALESLEEKIKSFAADKVPYDNIFVHHVPGKTDMEAQVASLGRVARAIDSATLIIPVEREVLMQDGPGREGIEWTKHLPDKRVILVHGPDKPVEGPLDRPLRVLIPVINKNYKELLELACSLNTNIMVPDVEVIAARVLELPTQSSQYSIYSQDSHSIGDEHLAFIKTHLSRAMQRLVHPMVLPVHHAGSDIADFAKNREVDLIMMEGRWRRKGQGILTQVEKDIVAKASCTVVVIMAHRTVNKRKADGPDVQEQY